MKIKIDFVNINDIEAALDRSGYYRINNFFTLNTKELMIEEQIEWLTDPFPEIRRLGGFDFTQHKYWITQDTNDFILCGIDSVRELIYLTDELEQFYNKMHDEYLPSREAREYFPQFATGG